MRKMKSRNPMAFMNNPKRGGKGVKGRSRVHARKGRRR